MGRADILFAKDKAIGAPLISLHAVPDLPKAVQERLYVVRFEDMLERPAACMQHIYQWLGLAAFEINPDQLQRGIRESDSHYHMKYTHQQSTQIVRPKRHDIPPRIQAQIEAAYGWFYQSYYPQFKC
jgi:sulfotransferase